VHDDSTPPPGTCFDLNEALLYTGLGKTAFSRLEKLGQIAPVERGGRIAYQAENLRVAVAWSFSDEGSQCMAEMRTTEGRQG